MNTQGHQHGSDRVKQVGCHDCPECIIRNAEGSCGARMEGPPNVSPLALEGETREGKQERTDSQSAQPLLFPNGRSFETCCFPRASQRSASEKSLHLPSTVINIKTKTHKQRSDMGCDDCSRETSLPHQSRSGGVHKAMRYNFVTIRIAKN